VGWEPYDGLAWVVEERVVEERGKWRIDAEL
jgi:hypothetical protein